MRLVVLGSGTCVPSGTRRSSGYWVEAGDARIRLDCGAGTVHAMAAYGLPWQRLSHQFISHFHVDHVGELPALLFAFQHGRGGPRTDPLTLVGPRGLETLLAGLSAAFGSDLRPRDFPLVVRELAPGDELPAAPGVRLLVHDTPHTAESLAVRIEAGGKSLGYTGDTAPSAELASFFAGVDLLLAECSFLEDPRGTRHLTAGPLAALARDAGARHLVATHSYFDPDRDRLADRLSRGYGGRVSLAHDGASFDVE